MNQPLSPTLSSEPSIAETSKLHNAELGRWVEIADRCILNNVSVGDYSYIQNDSNLMFAEVGKFTSIAASVRVNPSNHPWWRPTLHHFTYRPRKHFIIESRRVIAQLIFAWAVSEMMCGLATALSFCLESR